jgi:hypothetical protein
MYEQGDAGNAVDIMITKPKSEEVDGGAKWLHDPGPPLEPGPFALVVDILGRSRGRGILGEAGSTME